MSRGADDTRARLRASDPIDLDRTTNLARAAWADQTLARITATDRSTTAEHPVPAASVATRAIRWRPAFVVAAVLVLGVGTAVAALTGSIPDLFNRAVPTDAGGLPTNLEVIPSTLAHPVEIDSGAAAWGLWTGRTATHRSLIDVTMRSSASERTSRHTESVGMCPPITTAGALSVCLTRDTSGDGFVAGRAVSDVRRVELRTPARTYPGAARAGFFLVPANAGRIEWRSARLVARAADGRVIAVVPVFPGAR